MVLFDSAVEVYLPCWEWGAYLGDGALEEGVDACISSWNRMAPNTIPAMAKMAGNYLNGQLSKMEALPNEFAEAIALGPDGPLSEASGQNRDVVSRTVLDAPPHHGALLPGITRRNALTVAHDAQMRV